LNILQINMKTIIHILAVCAMGGLLLCALSVYAGGSIIVNATSPTHLIGAGVGNVRGRVVLLAQTITNFPNPGAQGTSNSVGLWAQASSGLDVTNFAVIVGPGTIALLTNLTFTGTGLVSVTANQAGNDSCWNVAPTVTNAINVTVEGWTYCAGRFSVLGTNQGVVIDNDSGLTWTRDANIGGTMAWGGGVASNYCASLTNSGYSDWRLPSITELSRDITVGSPTGLMETSAPILPAGHPFTNIAAVAYWSSTEFDVGNAWAVVTHHTQPGAASSQDKSFDFYIWPCRGP